MAGEVSAQSSGILHVEEMFELILTTQLNSDQHLTHLISIAASLLSSAAHIVLDGEVCRLTFPVSH